jgi:multiple sugar transport system substrate-binding protein
MEATTLALLYNRDMFRKAGLDPDHPPQSHAELDSFTRCLSRDFNGDGALDQYGFYVPVFPASGPLNLWMIMQWTPFVWQEGGEIFYQNQPVFNSQAGIHALNLWKKLYQDQHFERFSMAHDMGFMSQTVGMILDGPWNLPRYKNQIRFDWAVAPLPAGRAGKATYLSGEYLVVFKNCTDKQEAWKFLQWFMKKDVQRRFVGQSGYLPVRKSLLIDEEYRKMLKDYPQQKAFHALIEHARGRHLPDRYRVEVNQILANAIEQVVRGGYEAGNSLEKAERNIFGLLERDIK